MVRMIRSHIRIDKRRRLMAKEVFSYKNESACVIEGIFEKTVIDQSRVSIDNYPTVNER